jgi:tripartite motif-containing protein 71
MENSSVEQIKQRLTCPVCLDRYKQPKLLPCQHTFCLNPCLVNLVDSTTRRIKCPECRMIHTIPIQGVQVYPNNITIMRFLDLDLSKENVSKPADPNVCDQCNKRLDSISKCLECDKYFCSDCKPFHLTQAKNDTKQNIINLRRMLPQLSQKVGE